MSQNSIFSKALEAIKNPELALENTKKGNLIHYVQDAKRSILQHHKSAEIINKKEIRVIGLRRTGNHAIVKWIEKQHDGVVWYLNNLPLNENPYRHRYEYPEKSDSETKVANCYSEAKGNFTKKDCLIYSYEDYGIQQIARSNFIKKHDLYLGKSLKRYDVIILRDPFNLVASRLKSGKISTKQDRVSMVDMWLEYAKEFVRETQYLYQNKICINYNRWFDNVEYRQQLAYQLSMNFSDAGIDKVSHYGGGSSFDREKLQDKANQMDVLNRWKHFKNDLSYRSLFKNPQIFNYSEQIFGHIPGTEYFQS